jgi:opacity protein-like surface antigen
VLRSILATCVALLAAPAFAGDAPKTKWYASADVGRAKNGISEYAYGRQVAPRDSHANPFRVRAGYQFIRYFALEAAYVDLGSYANGVDMDCTRDPLAPPCVPDFRAEIEMQQLGLFGVGMIPIGDRLTVRATVGLSLREKKTRKRFVDGTDARHTGHMVTGSFGFGAGWAVNERLEVYGEWNRYDGKGGHPFPTGEQAPPGKAMEEAQIEVFSMGARWRF